jgi:hypothetical protein
VAQKLGPLPVDHLLAAPPLVERAKQLLQAGTDLSLAKVTACAGLADQNVFCRHFKVAVR